MSSGYPEGSKILLWLFLSSSTNFGHLQILSGVWNRGSNRPAGFVERTSAALCWHLNFASHIFGGGEALFGLDYQCRYSIDFASPRGRKLLCGCGFAFGDGAIGTEFRLSDAKCGK
jgi:hypothetical protein